MLITCSVSSSFWTCFFNWWHEKFNHKLTLSESTMFLLQAYATASWTLTVFYCVSTTKLIFFAPQLLDLTAYRNSKKHGTNFFRYVNASVISFKLHFTAILFHLSGLRLFPFNLVCLFFVCLFFSFTNFVCFLPYRYIYYSSQFTKKQKTKNKISLHETKFSLFVWSNRNEIPFTVFIRLTALGAY